MTTRGRAKAISLPQLSAAELNHARNDWIRKAQQEAFPDEYVIKSKGGPVSVNSRLQKLVPLMDEDSLLRITGRLNKLNAVSPLETRPILLCSKSLIAKCIVEDAHLHLCHGGAQLTMQYLRQQYWIVGAGTLVNSIIHRCVICCRYRQETARQLMADIPQMRLTPGPAIERCGVDYAGPLRIKEIRNVTTEGYIAVFGCMKYRAVHLELVSSLVTDSFLAALSRFINIRAGQVKYIYSDNGCNFVGAANKLRDVVRLWESSTVVNYLQQARPPLTMEGCGRLRSNRSRHI